MFCQQQGRAADNDVPFHVRETPEGIRLLIGEDANATQWEGVLDLSWGDDPQPYFRVDRIDTAEGAPVLWACVLVVVNPCASSELAD